MSAKTMKRIKTRTEIKLGKEDILQLLYNDGQISDNDANNSIVDFGVPTGGDYSGVDVEISNEYPIRVYFEIETTEVIENE